MAAQVSRALGGSVWHRLFCAGTELHSRRAVSAVHFAIAAELCPSVHSYERVIRNAVVRRTKQKHETDV